jgi:transposase
MTSAQWAIVSLVLPKRRGPIPTLDDRRFIDAVLYRLKTGCPWRDLPERFGPWKTVYNRFANWSHRGHWKRVFEALQIEFDEDGVILDASVVRAHQDAAGGKGGSAAMHWVVHVVDFPQRSTPLSTRRAVRAMSKSRRVSNTSQPAPSRSSNTQRAKR